MTPSPVCDLVLLSWNHLEQTQPCLESLFERTGVPCRLFIVDNGSEPSVRAFLKTVKPRGAIREVALLQNEQNEGFPKGMNRGIRASQAPFVCLLNNDLRFTTGWLEELIAVADANPEIGIVNPASSTFGEYPPEGVALNDYAGRLRRFHGQYTEVGMCIGFCVLIKRTVVERIGGLTEEVERIFFEDEDFSQRAQQAGFYCVVAVASYVYHAEHQTVRQMAERHALFTRNQRWCEQRWGRRIRMVWPRFQLALPGSAGVRDWLELILEWVRRRTHIYVYCPLPSGVTGEALFRSVGLIPHADVHWYAIPQGESRWASASRILVRRKKRFDVMISPEPGWGRLMSRFAWWHRASMVPAEAQDQLAVLWKQKSQSPSSS